MGRKSLYKINEIENPSVSFSLGNPVEEIFDGIQYVCVYRIQTMKNDGKVYISYEETAWPSSKEAAGKPPSKPKLPKSYNAFQRDLITPVINIDCDSKESIINFCNEYGLLNGAFIQLLEEFTTQVKRIQLCFKRFLDIRENVNRELSEDVLREYMFSWWFVQAGISPEEWLNCKDYQKVIRMILIHDINQQIKDVQPFLYFENGSFVPGYRAKTLISIIYYQLCQKIIQGSGVKKCRKCHRYFFPERANEEYCPKPKFGKFTRSPCENQYNRMKNWARNEVKNGRKTVEQIAILKKLPLEEVQGWFS